MGKVEMEEETATTKSEAKTTKLTCKKKKANKNKTVSTFIQAQKYGQTDKNADKVQRTK